MPLTKTVEDKLDETNLKFINIKKKSYVSAKV